MRLVWDSQSQIRRNDRVGLAASLEIKRSVFNQTGLGIGESVMGCSPLPSFLATRSGMQAVLGVFTQPRCDPANGRSTA